MAENQSGEVQTVLALPGLEEDGQYDAEKLRPVFTIPLKQAEAYPRPPAPKIGNVTGKYDFYEFKIQGSVLKDILLVTFILTLWSVLICVLYFYANWKFLGVSTFLINILALVVGLLLVFRTNTAYDRYWAARTLFGTLNTHIRNLSRFFFILPPSKTAKIHDNKYASTNLLLAFAVAVKHHLRDETGPYYEDLYPLLMHIPDFANNHKGIQAVENLPLEITFHISQHISSLKEASLIGIEAVGTEIEQPFGYDANDLRLDVFCEEIRKELAQLQERSGTIDSFQWTSCVHLGDYSVLRQSTFMTEEKRE
ncbi:hypothetical protein HDU91_007516 [Kappamyces sp. JEL0680]|nr:hypothetical protein HDU91_007516 [Kappamyces sp. JEL0680]